MEYKGLDVIGTGDFFHRQWQEEVSPFIDNKRIVASTEISLHFNNRGKKIAIHLVLVFSNAQAGADVGRMLSKIAPVERIARPDIFHRPIDFCHRIYEIDENCAIIPAHIFTPYFGGLGSRGMADLEVFDGNIKAVETGISADIEMCASVKVLEKCKFVSFSDAHSLQMLGREATVIKIGNVSKEILNPQMTIECYPEMGKYHATGHRKCSYSRENDNGSLACPVCGGKMTRGVAERLPMLERTTGVSQPSQKIVPLQDILRCTQGTAGRTEKQGRIYMNAIERIGNEFHILLQADENSLSSVFDDKTTNAITMLRNHKARVIPGYDGRYGSFVPDA